MALSPNLKKAIFASMLGKYTLYIFQLATISILARLFTPEIFGVVAAAQVFILFFQTTVTGALAPAIIDKGDSINNSARDGIFTFSILLGSCFFIALIFVGPLIFQWLQFSDGLIVFYLLAPSVLFAAVSMVPVASLQRDAKFLIIARAEIFAELIALVTVIILSFYKSPYTALAARFFCVAFFRLFFYYYFSKNTSLGRPRLGRKVEKTKMLYRYAKFQVLFNTLNFFSRNLDSLVVAKYFGAASLGSYEKTYQVMRYPLVLFTFALTPALQPILTKFKNHPAIIFREYLNLILALTIIGLFSGSMLYLCANEVVFILFGSQWEESVLLLKVLSLSIPIQMILASTGGIYQSCGETKHLFFCGVFGFLTALVAISIGVYTQDLVLMCYSIVLAINLNFLQCFTLLFSKIFKGLSYRPVIVAFLISNLVFLNLFLGFDTIKFPNSIGEAITSIFIRLFFALIASGVIFLVFRIYVRRAILTLTELHNLSDI